MEDRAMNTAHISHASVSDCEDINLSRVTYVIAGFSMALLPVIERNFTDGQVLFLEEPEVVEMREVTASCAAVPAVAGVLTVPSQDENAAEALPRLIPRPPNLIAVLPGVEYGVVAAAALADCWRVRGAGLKAARTLRGKAELRRVADAAGIPQPRWRVARCPRDIEEFRSQHGGECVLKPTNRQGSLGVELIGPRDDAEGAWEEVVAAREPGGLRARQGAMDSEYIVEERMSGAEISIQALVAGGRIVFANTTVKDVLPGRYPIELGHTTPGPISADVAAQLVEQTHRIVRVTAFQYGMLHAEWIFGETGPGLVECAARIPGDRITTLIDFAYGTRVVDDLLRIMEGSDTSSMGQALLGASIRYLTAKPGVVVSIAGVDRAREVEDVIDVDVAVREGSVVRPLRSSLDRVGSVLTVAAEAGEARESAIRAAAAIRISTKATLGSAC
jgi:biotin carboxylase